MCLCSFHFCLFQPKLSVYYDKNGLNFGLILIYYLWILAIESIGIDGFISDTPLGILLVTAAQAIGFGRSYDIVGALRWARY